MLRVYNLIYNLLIIPIILIASLFSKKLNAGKKEKFGGYDFKIDEKTIWIHAVSVGEVMLAQSIIEKLNLKNIVLTTSTPQGQELAKVKLSDKCTKITYFPYDTKSAINKAIKAINPKAVIIVETEIWPCFAKCLKDRNIELFIVNGRISERTFKSYKKLRFFFKNVLENYTAILAQSEDDRQRFIQMGAKDTKVVNLGNIKFDLKKPDEHYIEHYKNLLKLNDNKVLIFGSTHQEENEGLIAAFENIKNQNNGLKLIIAPRHLEKVPQIEKILTNKNIKWGKKSQGATFSDNDAIILDTTGELGKIYSICDICVICGSFNNTGGHNPLEATVWGKTTISGSNVKNFKYIYKTLTELDCSFIVNDYAELEGKVLELLNDENYLKQVEQNCKKALETNSGALDKTVQYISKYL